MAIQLMKKIKSNTNKANMSLRNKEPKSKPEEKFSFNMLNTKATDPTDAVFGIKPDGTIAHFCISVMPHLLVAGTTGSGKSVLLNEILVTAICHSSPEELKIGIVDPKRVEFGRYKKLPYMLADPITDMDDAYDFFEYLTIMMNDRYKIMEKVGMQNIKEYNKYAHENGLDRFPYVILLVDEFSQLIGRHKEVENLIVELGQMARAAGIHVILATQSPRSTVVTGIIKANFPSRVCMMVASELESRIVLDQAGGESLSPRGDMLISVEGADPIRAQGAFISNEEIETIFNHIRENMPDPEYVDYKSIVAESRGEVDDDQDDFGGIKAPNQRINRGNLRNPLANVSSKEQSIEKKSPFAVKLEERKKKQEEKGYKPLEKLQAEKLARLEATLNNISSEGHDDELNKRALPSPKSKTPLKEKRKTSKDESSINTTSPVMLKMMQAKKQVKK
ncbi:FtsK/SpoIIIE domain-containing protein [Enterococcus faecium]|nr:FtsK/SpoIIIE domain-containing protein [Enterococcus faecium]